MRKSKKDIIILDSNILGPTISIVSGIHGNEPVGISAFKELKKLKIIRGRIQLIYGNVRAIRRKKRFIDTDLNRLFQPKNQLTQKQIKSYEYKRSREIMLFLDKADILLDIHSTSKKTPPFIICESNSRKIVRYFPFKIRCYGFDAIHPGSTDYYMNQKGKIGIGIECGQHNDKLVVKRAIWCIKILLIFLKMIKGRKLEAKKQTIYKTTGIYKTKTNRFVLTKNFRNFEAVSKNQIIATDGKDKIISKNNQFIIFAQNNNRVSAEGFVYLRQLTK